MIKLKIENIGDKMKKRLRLWVKILIIIIILTVITLLYGFFINSRGFKVNEIPLYEDIPDNYNGLKIVHISDIYYGNDNKAELKKIVNRINLIKPDIVVFTGDLLYKDTKVDSNLNKELSRINSNIDKYYITGDNDYNNDDITNLLNNSGFINLNDTYNLIYKDKVPILLAGISTSKNKDNILKKLEPTFEYIDNNDVLSILLMHEPNKIEKFDYSKFNLILAGHTLGGVIRIPLIGGIILPKDNNLYGNSHYKKKNTDIYISNGLGNKDTNFRLFNKPSFNFYRIRKK